MTNVIKKNQKKLMAIFAVLLMISFVATIGVGRSGGGGREDVVIAHMGSTPVYAREMQSAKEQWAFLKQTPAPPSFVSQFTRRTIPVAADALIYSFVSRNPPRVSSMDEERSGFQQWFARYQMAEGLAGYIVNTIDRQSELFYLLQADAERNGIRIGANSDEVAEYLRNVLNVDPNEISDTSTYKQGVRGILLVAADIRRLMDALKVSQPDWQHAVAGEQAVKLYLADFRASDFEKSIPAPTTQALQEHFDKYKNIPASQPSDTNPLGFGYQIPTRVKLQYIEIPRSAVLSGVVQHVPPPNSNELAVGTSDPQYLWTVKAATYYDDHKEDYRNPPPPATKPATQSAATSASTQTASTQSASTQVASSQPASTEMASAAPATQPASQPVYKPFVEVKDEIIEKLAADEVDKLMKKITDDLTSRLNADYTAIARANPAATQPTTEPASARTLNVEAAMGPSTRPADELLSLAHLEAIRAQLEQTYHVPVALHEMNAEWQTVKDLPKLPGIGSATTPDGAPFTEYATRLDTPSALHVWQPSEPLSDSQHNNFIFRLIAAQPAHAPPSMAPIAQQIEADWKLAESYDMAKQSATKLLASAKSVGLSQAASTAGLDIRTTGFFQPSRGGPIPGYPLEDATALRQLNSGTADLLKQATPADPKPDKLIELPSAHRVVVAELAGVHLPTSEGVAQMQATEGEQEARLDRLAAAYFDYDKVVQRLGYKPEEKQ
jgi:hypothetical protein